MRAKPSDPYTRTKKRFGYNIERVRNLVSLHETTDDSDVLRSAVVFLHATLEDLLRCLLGWKLPDSPIQFLEDVLFNQESRQQVITVAQLANHRHKSVRAYLCELCDAHLSRTTFNDAKDVIRALKTLGQDVNDFRSFLSPIGTMMSRRHKIVHESDREPPGVSSHGQKLPIDNSDVEKWTTAVNDFVLRLLDRLDPKKTKRPRAAPTPKLVLRKR